MGHCPFCGSEVDGDLLVFGGTCPKCFGEIPGEEAPTDPGEERRKAQEKQDRAGIRRRTIVRISLSVALFFATILAVLSFILRPEPVLPVIDFDKAMVEQPTTLVAWAGPEEAAPAEAAKTPRNGMKRPAKAENLPTGPKVGPEEDVDLSAYLAQNNTLGAGGPRGPRAGSTEALPEDVDAALSGGSVSLKTGPVAIGGVQVQVNKTWSAGQRITNDAEIFAHVKTIMDVEAPKLTQCYQQALKMNEALEGKWRIDFVVDRDSGVKGVGVTGLDMQDAGFETCVAEKISRWQFNPLRADQPVRKTLTFRQR